VHFRHVERVGILQSNPALYTYMVAETGLTFTSFLKNSSCSSSSFVEGQTPLQKN
jgi:hypothetical protein